MWCCTAMLPPLKKPYGIIFSVESHPVHLQAKPPVQHCPTVLIQSLVMPGWHKMPWRGDDTVHGTIPVLQSTTETLWIPDRLPSRTQFISEKPSISVQSVVRELAMLLSLLLVSSSCHCERHLLEVDTELNAPQDAPLHSPQGEQGTGCSTPLKAGL